MFNTDHLTSFVVIHTVWVMLVADSYFYSFMLFYLTESCNYWLVITTQLENLLWTSLGMISLPARLIDKQFRQALTSMFYRQARKKRVVQMEANLLSARLASVEYNPNYKFTIFESLHMKVSSRQFILDSLISLSFYLARESIYSSDGVES
jgi:hypothetical protein